MSLTRFVLRFAVPTPDILKYQRFLFVGPHPDDIEIGAGATAAKLAAMGKSVSFLICTDGRFGIEHAPEGTTPQALIPLRKQEAMASAEKLGVGDVRFLNFPDGGGYDRDFLLRQMAWEIGRFRPDVIFAPDPDVTSECHADHRKAGDCARELAFFAPFEPIMARCGASAAPVQAVAFYMTAKPNYFVDTTSTFAKQAEALGCHQSQFPTGDAATRSLMAYLKLRARDFGLRSFHRRAEGFRVLGRTQMHCIPEFGD